MGTQNHLMSRPMYLAQILPGPDLNQRDQTHKVLRILQNHPFHHGRISLRRTLSPSAEVISIHSLASTHLHHPHFSLGDHKEVAGCSWAPIILSLVAEILEA